MLAVLGLCLVIVGVSVALTFALRATIGPKWLETLVLGVHHFDGIRPVWNDLQALRAPRSGPEALVGCAGTALADFAERAGGWSGPVRVGAEIWAASSAAQLAAGQEARILEVEGLRGLSRRRRLSALARDVERSLGPVQRHEDAEAARDLLAPSSKS